MEVPQWVFVHRLAADIDATNYSSEMRLATQVAIDLTGAASAVKDLAPQDGAIFVSTADGVVIAGSNWEPAGEAQYDPASDEASYPFLSDLDLGWTSAVSSEMIAGSEPSEAWNGDDIVVVRPLAVGNPAGGSHRAGFADLRIMATVPRKSGTSQEMKNLVTTAMTVMGTPGAFIVLAIVLTCVSCCTMSCAAWLYDHID